MKNILTFLFLIILLCNTSCKNENLKTKCEEIEKSKSVDDDFIESLVYRHVFKSLAIIDEYKVVNQIDKKIPTKRIANGQNYWTPLCFASFIGNKSIVRALIDNGANIKYRDKNGKTPFILAALGGNIEEMDILIRSGANINEEDNDNTTALITAAAEGNLKTVEYLVEKGCVLEPSEGLNALDYAIFHQHKDVIDYLSKKGMKKSPR